MQKKIFLAGLILFFLSAGTVQADHVSCGGYISDSTVLDSGLNCTGNGLIINASNIVLDCNGHTIQGNNYVGTGIYNPGFQDVTIKNCVIQSFSNGLYLQDSNSSTLQNIIANNNRGGITYGLYISGSNNVLQNITANNNFGGTYSYGLYVIGSNNTL
ncbi:MAG: right-handed parallel beta-helix repeat-containing protein, partial [Nanoarchaeota archaeon]